MRLATAALVNLSAGEVRVKELLLESRIHGACVRLLRTRVRGSVSFIEGSLCSQAVGWKQGRPRLAHASQELSVQTPALSLLLNLTKLKAHREQFAKAGGVCALVDVLMASLPRPPGNALNRRGFLCAAAASPSESCFLVSAQTHYNSEFWGSEKLLNALVGVVGQMANDAEAREAFVDRFPVVDMVLFVFHKSSRNPVLRAKARRRPRDFVFQSFVLPRLLHLCRFQTTNPCACFWLCVCVFSVASGQAMFALKQLSMHRWTVQQRVGIHVLRTVVADLVVRADDLEFSTAALNLLQVKQRLPTTSLRSSRRRSEERQARQREDFSK